MACCRCRPAQHRHAFTPVLPVAASPPLPCPSPAVPAGVYATMDEGFPTVLGNLWLGTDEAQVSQ